MIRWLNTSRVRPALLLVCLIALAAPTYAKPGDHAKLDTVLNARAGKAGFSRVIVRMTPGRDASPGVKLLGGRLGKHLGLIHGRAAEVPNALLRKLADLPAVASVHFDRPTGGEMNRVAVTVGARAVQQQLGGAGAGVGVAIIDSGITSWHDDLTYAGNDPAVQARNGQRVAAFVDFVNGAAVPYDDHGHGTHVAGIIAGNGFDSRGAHAGIAPAAHLVGLKVLDSRGRGVISDVIAALEWTVRNKAAYNIRVANVSVGAAVTESYRTDPLTLAAKAAVDAGIVVVAAAGNLGKNSLGQVQYGGITAPANAPWVLTVGAYSHEGTVTRVDDVIALYSSRGPTRFDYQAKPDLVAPGTGIVSLSDPTSTLYATKPGNLLKGSISTSYRPYLSLSGTSMAAPIVAGTVAAMMQVNPNLTPNLAKAILQYTAQQYSYDALTQGAGFINTRDAVHLARSFAGAAPDAQLAAPKVWSRQIIWGTRRLTQGRIDPSANAWETTTTWGSAVDGDGSNIVWGTLLRINLENIVWGTLLDENIVWGTFLGFGENIVWGTAETENVVWGSDCAGADCEGVVWGSLLGGLFGSLENIVWGTAEGVESLLWNLFGAVENIVWGTSSEADNVTWGLSGGDGEMFADPEAEPVTYDALPFDNLFRTTTEDSSSTATAPAASSTTTTTTTTVTNTVTGILGGGL